MRVDYGGDAENTGCYSGHAESWTIVLVRAQVVEEMRCEGRTEECGVEHELVPSPSVELEYCHMCYGTAYVEGKTYRCDWYVN